MFTYLCGKVIPKFMYTKILKNIQDQSLLCWKNIYYFFYVGEEHTFIEKIKVLEKLFINSYIHIYSKLS